MKRSIFNILMLFLLTGIALAQEKESSSYSTIHFIRSANYFGSGCRTDITLPNQREFNLSLKSIVNYQVYSEGEVTVTLEILCPASQNVPARSASTQITLNITRGNEYYVLYHKNSFKQVEKADAQKFLDEITNIMKHEENIENPINRSSLDNANKKNGKGQGSCFLISSNGYLITNYHCVENAKEIYVQGIGGDYTTKYGATVIATDPSNDLALIKISNANVKFDTPPFAIKSTGVLQAEKVYALGYPNAYAMGTELKITEGIISSKSGAQGDVSKYQISAAVNPGNSGGPLIDEHGDLIGVIYAKSTMAESAGYAIKSSYLETFLKNVDGFTYPNFINTMEDKPFTEKVSLLKACVYIIETN